MEANKKKIIITVPEKAIARGGNHKSWRKHLTGVDQEKTNGYAFQGEWLSPGERAELPIGAYILAFDALAVRRNRPSYPKVRLFRVLENGDLDPIYKWEGGEGERSWALAVRDDIAEIVVGNGPLEEQELDREKENLDDLARRLAALDEETVRTVLNHAEKLHQ